jgi:hypothetical protein
MTSAEGSGISNPTVGLNAHVFLYRVAVARVLVVLDV